MRCSQQSISNSGHFSRQIAISDEYNCHTFLLISKDVKLSTKNMIVLKVRYVQNTYYSTIVGIIRWESLVQYRLSPLTWDPLIFETTRTIYSSIERSEQKIMKSSPSIRSVKLPHSPTGYRKRTAQILRATHFYDLLM